eukprot:5348826-Prymnesium_polylepis.1
MPHRMAAVRTQLSVIRVSLLLCLHWAHGTPGAERERRAAYEQSLSRCSHGVLEPGAVVIGLTRRSRAGDSSSSARYAAKLLAADADAATGKAWAAGVRINGVYDAVEALAVSLSADRLEEVFADDDDALLSIEADCAIALPRVVESQASRAAVNLTASSADVAIASAQQSPAPPNLDRIDARDGLDG